MFGGQNDLNKNLKDTPHGQSRELGITVKDTLPPVSYNKTNKLITALYMVTDIMDKEEPMRNKLRTLGTGIISDMHYAPQNALPKISETMSLLDIAGVVSLISEMNLNILRKEFFALKNAIDDSIEVSRSSYTELSLSGLFSPSFTLPTEAMKRASPVGLQPREPRARLGVQKGSTLMKALSDTNLVSHGRPLATKPHRGVSDTTLDFEAVKKQRRDQIMSVIRLAGTGCTITDIKSKANGSLTATGEKTLQRELVAMVKEGILKKEGEKRWSRYFLA